jgi:hypothetical protein
MNKYIEVNTTYARIALILLTLNFALTTYAIVKIADSPSNESTSTTPQTTEQTSTPESS